MFYTYILFSNKINKFYIGHSSNVFKRFQYHNTYGTDFTSKGKPWVLIWFSTKPTKSEASRLEKKIKNLSRKRIVQFIQKYNEGIQEYLDIFDSFLEC